MKLYRATFLLSFVVSACGAGDETNPQGEPTPDPEPEAPKETGPTYHGDIRPLIEANCVSCHTEDGIGPFALDEWESVKDLQSLVVGAVETGLMPPWPASDACHEIADVAALPETQRKLFTEWRDAGYPEGDEEDYEPAEAVHELDLGEEDLLFEPAEGYTPNRNIDDEYRCFLTKGTIEKDTYLTAMDIRPGVRAQVHHVQVHKISSDLIEDVKALDDEAPGAGYPCVGAGVTSVNMFSWRPGSQAVAFDDGDAAFMEGGSAIVLQVHYNNQFLEPGQDPLPDTTGVAFWTLPSGEVPERVVWRAMHLGPVGPPATGYPLGLIGEGENHVEGVAETAFQILSTVEGQYVQGELIGVTPHMHTLGTRLSETMMLAGDDSPSCVVDVPHWDFEWQLDYTFATPVNYGPEDQLKLVCEYDNSPANQPFLNGERIQPRNVTWGEGSLDEMCLNYVWFRAGREPFLAAREAAAEARAAAAAQADTTD